MHLGMEMETEPRAIFMLNFILSEFMIFFFTQIYRNWMIINLSSKRLAGPRNMAR